VSLSANQRHDHQRLAPVLLELFPQRVMLSSRELSEIVTLEASGVPFAQITSWAHELSQARTSKGPLSLSALLTQLSQRTRRWRSTHIGEKYQQETTLSPQQIAQAFEALLSETRRAEAEQHDPQLRGVLSWLNGQLSSLAQSSLNKGTEHSRNHLNIIFDQLEYLSLDFQDRIFLACPDSLKERLRARVHELLAREALRARPQDLIIAQRAVWWSLIEGELSLPPIRLRLFDQW
jgi:hypothetical protein